MNMNFNATSKNVETREITFRKGDIVMVDLPNDIYATNGPCASLLKCRPCVIMAVNDWNGVATVIPLKSVHTDEERDFLIDTISKSERIGYVIRNQDIFNRDIVFCLSHPITKDISDFTLFKSSELRQFTIPSVTEEYLKLLQVGFGIAMDIPFTTIQPALEETPVSTELSKDTNVSPETSSTKESNDKVITLYDKERQVVVKWTLHDIERFLYECENHTKNEVAKMYGVSTATVYRWERNILLAYCNNAFN